MSVLLVVGFTVVIVTIAARVSHRRPDLALARPGAAAPIEIPRGARVEAMTTTADRLILDFALPNGDRQILMIDMATGARVGVIDLDQAPAARPPAAPPASQQRR